MKRFSLLTKLSLAIFLNVLVAKFANAYITPYLITYSEVGFGKVMFTNGNCTLDHDTGEVSNSTPDYMCNLDGSSVAGYYRIIANPNKQVSIKILQRDNTGDGFIYIPGGELSSDAETLVITPNIAQEIDSGSNGNIYIRLGGTLHITKDVAPSKEFVLTRAEGIEWSELP